GPGGAVVAAGLSTLVYGYTVTGLALGWFVPPGGGTVGTLQDALGSLTRHSLAFLASGLLCARLAREVRLGRTQLRELGEMYRKIVDNVSSGLMTVDREGRIASFNREAERISGWGREEAVGTALAAVLPTVADRVRGTETSDDDSIGVPGEVAARRAVAATVRGGRELFLGFSTSPLRGEKGEPEGQIVIFQDLTRVVEMERRLRLSERLAAVGQLAAGLAHEVRNPLASLSGAIELLERETRPAAESSVRLFGIVQRETRRLNRLVSDFLDFARPSPPRPGSVPLLSLLEEVRDLIGRGGPNMARVEIDVPDGCVVVGDRDQLHQLLWNLLLNAVQAEPRDDTVRVRARLETSESGDPTVEVTVEDRGQGIPAEVLSQVFDPFFTTKAKGTGLGLATVHRILEAHGGSAEISSQVGEGTTVRVRLPAGES
ncbi:MAG: ATP-binding protein, partial [Myxococcota bacterium]